MPGGTHPPAWSIRTGATLLQTLLRPVADGSAVAGLTSEELA
jgi:hypothetical protein